MQDNKYWFFGSKLNTALLLILIILMVFAIKIMLRNEQMYLPSFDKTEQKDISVAREILGRKDDLVSFSVLPNSKVGGVLSYQGAIKGAYFFEANIVINILDAKGNLLKQSNTMATTDWMTAEPVSFAGSIDLTGLAKGPAYFEIHNDNASGLPEHDKSILIPIVIE
jgi:hypothetical protein